MKTKYLAFAAAAFMLASCSNDEDFVPQDNLKDTPITVSAAVEGMLTRAGYETNADDDTKSVLPETFYLSIDQAGEDCDYTDVLMTKNAGTATYSAPEGTTLWWKEGNHEAAAVNAYTIKGTDFTVETDQSTDANVIASDLLGAVSTTEGDVTVSGNNIGICFRHLLCKLDVTFKWGTEFSTENKTIKSVVYSGFGISATLNRKDGVVTANETPTDITAYMNGTTSEAIFAPYVGTAPSIVISTTIDGAERDFAIGVNAPAGSFASGNRYTMNVTIGGTAVEDGSVTATLANGWETGDANGDADGTDGNMATN